MVLVGVGGDEPCDTFPVLRNLEFIQDVVFPIIWQRAIDDGKAIGVMLNVEHVSVSDRVGLHKTHFDSTSHRGISVRSRSAASIVTLQADGSAYGAPLPAPASPSRSGPRPPSGRPAATPQRFTRARPSRREAAGALELGLADPRGALTDGSFRPLKPCCKLVDPVATMLPVERRGESDGRVLTFGPAVGHRSSFYRRNVNGKVTRRDHAKVTHHRVKK